MTALREVWRNRDIRRAQLAWGGFHTAEWASLVALSVVAYTAYGTTALGVVLFARMAASGLVTPFAAVLGDRLPRERILLGVHALRVLSFAGAATALLAGGSTAAALGLAIVGAVPLAAHRPAHLGLMPVLARTPAQLTASNAAAMLFESGAALAGPGMAALLLAFADAGIVFAACAGLSAVSVLLILRVRSPWKASPTRRTGLHQLGDGVHAVVTNPHVRLVVGLAGAQTLVRGFLGVFIAVIALELVGLGEPGVGLLSAAFGLGGLLGAVAAVLVVGRGGVGRPFQLSLAFWGLPLAFVGLVPSAGVALLALAVAGLANTVLDVAAFTSLQERADANAIGRIFGLLELVVIAAIGVGSLLAPVAVGLIGDRVSLVVVGALLPLLALLFHRPLGRLDEGSDVRVANIELLRGNEIFAPLPYITLGALAASLERRSAAAGDAIVREGDSGGEMYVIAAGGARVTKDGRLVADLVPGDVFGEIALLLDVPRTATATATEALELVVVGRERFIGAMTGHCVSGAAARALVDARVRGLEAVAGPA